LGFTLIELVIAVLVLAIAVPPTLSLLNSAADGRVDAINTTRATFLATSVAESIMADMSSEAEGLGFQALENSDAYLNDPSTGLRTRLQPHIAQYTSFGFTYTVEIGELVSSDGVASGQPTENVFRVITLTVRYPSTRGAEHAMPVSFMVSEL